MSLNAGGISWAVVEQANNGTFANGLEAMRALRDYLQSRLNEDYANVFTDANDEYITADVILEDDEPQESDQVGRPYVVLALGSDDVSQFSDSRGSLRDCAVEVECVASDFSGAQTGIANPVGSDTLLSQALASIIRDDYTILRDAGLMSCEFRTSSRERIENSDAGEIHRNPHRITFRYVTE